MDKDANELGKCRSAFQRIIDAFGGGRPCQPRVKEAGDVPNDVKEIPARPVEIPGTSQQHRSLRIASTISEIQLPAWDGNEMENSADFMGNTSNSDVKFQVDSENEHMLANSNAEDEDESQEIAARKSKIRHIFECIEEWRVNDITGCFVGLHLVDKAVLDASWKGELDLLEEALENTNPNQIKSKVNCKDREGRTPLMLAAAFGNSQVVQFLIQNGAEVNVWDNNYRATPLVCAAACGNSSVLSILLANGASVNAADFLNKTALFWAVQSGSVSCVRKLLESGAKPNLVALGTPLHAAASLPDEDAVPIMEILLEFQANPGLQRIHDLQTPLHLATEEGNLECMELLLRNDAPRDVGDAHGLTPLHIAAKNCDLDAMELLVASNANPNLRDSEGRTPLHRVISKDIGAPECMKFLLDNGAHVDAQDDLGHTPLTYAVLNDCAQLAGILLKHGSDITKRSKAGKDCLSLIVRKMPHVIQFIRESLDNAVSIQQCDPSDHQCNLKLDFRAIITKSYGAHGTDVNTKTDDLKDNFHHETEFITSLVQTGHKALLSHPLVEAFIILKWKKVRPFLLASVMLHTFLVVLYTSFVLGIYVYLCPYMPISNSSQGIGIDSIRCSIRFPFQNVTDHPVSEFEFDGVHCDLRKYWYVQAVWVGLTFSTILICLKEIFHMVQSFKQYVTSAEYWAQWSFLISIFMAIWPVPMDHDCLEYWHYPSAAIGIFIGWCLMLVHLGKFPLLGIYVQMLAKVIKNFALFIIAYVCLLVAFALAFCILFPSEPTFKPSRLILTIIVMLVGELNYDDLFYKESGDSEKRVLKELQHPFSDQLMFGGFVVIVTIILMNLLVGLAVSDIQSLTVGAKMDRLARQTNSMSQLESFLFSRGLQFVLPDSIGKFLRRTALLVPSSYKWTFYFKPNDPRDTRLPTDVQKEALKLATSKQFRRKASRSSRKHVRGSKWVSTLQQKDLQFFKFEERMQNNLKRELSIGFERINQRIDELMLKVKVT